MSEKSARIGFLQEKARAASEGPGVYRMLDKSGKILYIGKAKSLTNRVRSYFAKTIEDDKTRALVAKIHDFEVILTNSEAEALILENILIKRYKPRYNIVLKDDKSYPYVAVDESHAYPKLVYTRKPKKKTKQRLFGPFASSISLREALRFLNRNFQLRDCSDMEFQNRARPCINHQIGICSAPCMGLISAENYNRDLQKAMQLLGGHGSEALRKLKNEMDAAAEGMEYEKAARLRDQLALLEDSFRRRPRTPVSENAPEEKRKDVVGWCRKDASASIALLFFRGGDLVDSASFHFDHLEGREDQEVLASFLAQFYLVDDRLEGTEAGADAIPGAEAKTFPDEIVLPFEVSEQALFEESFEKLGHKVALLIPQKGIRHEQLLLAEKNAANAFEEIQREKGSIYRTLAELKAKLMLENYPRRIECFDISNLGDTGIVASRVTFIEGKADKSLYRHYKIRTTDGQNDFAAMKEVIERRLYKTKEEGKNFEEPPDLLVIDGGKGQLSMAVQVMKELDITGVDIVALAKSKTASDFEGREVEKTFERVFKPGRMNPIVLPPDSAVCHLMQRVRDEAHRFAVEFQRKQRNI